jgi:hypothetical protein
MDYLGVNYDFQDNVYLISNIVPASTLTPPPTGTATPASLTATDGATTVSLNWAANTDAISGYNVYRAPAGSSAFQKLTASLLTAPGFTDSTVTAGASYTYQVTAVGALGESTPAATTITHAGGTVGTPVMPTGLKGTDVPTGIFLDWQPNPGNVIGYNLYRAEVPGHPYVKLNTSPITNTAFDDTGAAMGSTYSYRLTAVYPNGESGNVELTVGHTMAPVVPGPFVATDIGSPGIAGNIAIAAANTGYDVTGSGADVATSPDQLQFAQHAHTGDFDVKVRLAAFNAADPFAKAGLMVRQTLGADSRDVYIMATPGSQGFRFGFRKVTGAQTSIGRGGSVSYPNTWVRLRRSGSTFTGYYSSDGITWHQLGTVNLLMPTTLYFGLAVTSHSNGATATAQFRDMG